MKKPEKKECRCFGSECYCGTQQYNQACEDWEKFLPSGKSILEIIVNYCGHIPGGQEAAKAVFKRLRGEK